MDLVQLLDIADKITTVGLLIILMWAIKERWVVPGWVYDTALERIKVLEDLANRHATRIESKLDTYEAEERKRWQGTQSHERP